MVTKVIKKEKQRSCFFWAKLLWLALMIAFTANEAASQTYQLTLQQRRMGDMIGVEIWIKDVTANGTAPALGNASIGIIYNTSHLQPASLIATSSLTTELHNPDPTTDSVNFDVDIASPYETITSPFINAGIGYNALSGQAVVATSGGVTLNAFVLDVNFEAGQGYTGVKPATTGRGTYIGMLKFDIIDHTNLDCTDLTGINWNPYTFAGDITIEDISGNNMEPLTNLAVPGDMTIRGITVLNPNGPNQAVNRDPSQALASLDPNKGYPVYFERSGLENPGTYLYGANNYAYKFEYSLDGGSSWAEFGRVAESNLTAGGMANVDYYRSGEIDVISSASEYYVTRGDGTAWATAGVNPVGADGYNGVLRIIWKSSENFQYRSENAKLQITQLQPTGAAANILSRSAYSDACRSDASNSTFVLGRLFFVQLDGTSGYFRTKNKFSNPTQLTVEAWINLNGNTGAGSEPAIVASASGESSPEEGAWMLYLQDGNRPAFRVRENEGRGPDGYIAKLTAPMLDTLSVVSDAAPIVNAHGDNWTHIAATVRNGLVTLYVNGEIVAQELNTESVNPRIMTSTLPIWIGVNPNFGISANDYLHAGIKEVKVWRYALPQSVLRSHVSGVYDPDGTINALTVVPGDERTSLELYYTFQGIRADVADQAEYQYAANPLNYYNATALSATAVNNLINYRPDRSHIKLTSPTGGEGVNNLKDQVFEVRWVGYGLGKIEPASEDLQIMVSRDGGLSWFDAIDNQEPTAYLLDNVEIESGEASWEPYNGITTAGADDDLQGVVPLDENWAKNCLLKISGTEARNQSDIFDISGPFSVAPYFALSNTGSQVFVDEGNEFNLTGNNGFLEAWIKPYRFPTTDEVFFPIITKKSADGLNMHYSFRLLPTGSLQFVVSSSTGDVLRTANSDAINRIVKPNVRDFDSTWVHVGVWFNLANQSQVIFYIDGIPQLTDTQMEQLGTNITVDNLNTYPTFIGSEPISADTSRVFIGEMREVRYWSGNPGNQANTGSDPTPMTKFIQGASTIRSSELTTIGGVDYSQNLVAAFPLNGGSFINNGFMRSVAAYPVSNNIVGHIGIPSYTYYNNTKPLIKLIEPKYKQAVPNTKTDLRVRWVGFDYNRNNLTSFRNGSDGLVHADLKFGTSGGADIDVVHYQNVTSLAYDPSYVNAMTVPNVSSSYEFQGTTNKSQYSLNLDMSVTDPDLNDDGTYNDYGPVKATLTNGRLMLKGRSTINGYTIEFENGTDGLMPSLLTESPLFNITPPSNFTVRVLLEGYHAGLAASQGIKSNLGTSLNGKGLKIKLFTNNANNVGVIVDSAESTERYANATTAFDPANRNAGSNDFANVPFVFTEIDDGRYFVVVDHLNHLPIMSRYAAPFQYAGDEAASWDIESGWDFQNWGGAASAMTESDAAASPVAYAAKYSAHGFYETDENKQEYASTGLNYNDGRSGLVGGNSVAAMVGGDAVKDYKINGLDRTRVRLDAGGSFNRSDITGDGFVNGTDRQIVDRNNQKVSSLLDVFATGAPMIQQVNPNDEILPEGPEISTWLYNQSQKYLANGGEKIHNSQIIKGFSNKIQGALQYRVKGITKRNGGNIDVALYIKNESSEAFALGNCSFGVQFDASALIFTDMVKSEDIIWNDREDMGYAKTYAGPGLETKEPIPAVKTIEIDYDAYTELLGANVPNNFSYLGTIRFKILSDKDFYDFEWHPITVVHAIDGRDVTGDGIFEDFDDVFAPKIANIVYPNGGEKWRAGNVYDITWTQPTIDKPVYIDYSTDNGATWNRISQSTVALASTEFTWKTPGISSSQCLIAIIDAETGKIIDRSDAPFAIMPSNAAITRPAAEDPVYKGNTEDFIKWVVDEQASVKFEFSPDGNSNWISVSQAKINTDDGQSSWKIPAVNSKNAVVRMVNSETGEVMAVSEPFRILAGSLTLDKISPDNQVKMGENRPIKWLYDNVGRFDLQFTDNGGVTWTDIQKDLLALASKLDWVIPMVETGNAVIRAIWNHDPDMEYSRTPQFSIVKATGVDELEKLGYKLEAPVPNPFRTSAQVNFTLPVNTNISMVLFNATGTKVKDLIENKEYAMGAHHISVSSDGLAAGVYYIRLNVGIFSLTREIVLVK